jgi:hypothetical protein
MIGSIMAQKVYGIITDGGDGSAGIRWYTNKELVDHILSDDYEYFDYVQVNEGIPIILTLPDNLDLKEAGFYIQVI